MLTSQTIHCHCVGCDQFITDRFLLSVVGQSWPVNCLRCAQCGLILTDRCYVRNGKLYCCDHFKSGQFQRRRHDNRRVEDDCANVVESKDGISLAPNNDVSIISLTHPSEDDDSSTGRCQEYGCHANCLGNNCTSKPRSQKTPYIDVSRHTADEDDSRLVEDRDTGTDLEDCRGVQNTDVTAQCNGVEYANYSNSDNDDTNSTSRRSSSILDGCIAVDQTDTRIDEPVADEDSSVNAAAVGCSNRQREPRTTISGPQLNALLAAFNDTPKPPRQAREQLAARTGLSMRVIQVWFQNRRSKERRLRQLTVLPMTRRSAVLHPLQQAGLSISVLGSSVNTSAASAASTACSSPSTRFDDGEQHHSPTATRAIHRHHASDDSGAELDERPYDSGSVKVGVPLPDVTDSWCRLMAGTSPGRMVTSTSSMLPVCLTTGQWVTVRHGVGLQQWRLAPPTSSLYCGTS